MTPEPADPSRLIVPAHETGVIRIFAPKEQAPQLAAVLPPHPVDGGHFAPLLSVETIRDQDVERIALRDLGEYSFSEFLRIGHDVRSSDLGPIRADLDALTGQAFLVHSTAFGGRAVTLRPHPALRFCGAVRRNDAPITPLSLPEAEKPDILTPPPQPATQGRPVGLGLVLLCLVGALALALLWGLT